MFDKDQKLNRMTLKNAIVIITYTVLLVWGVLHFQEVWQTITMIMGMLKPFIYGFMLAFLFNLPMKFYARKLPDTLGKWKKTLAAILSIASILIIVTFIIWIVLPQIVNSIAALLAALPGYVDTLIEAVIELIEDHALTNEILDQLNAYTQQIQDFLLNFIKNGLPQLIGMANNLASSIANIFLSLVIAVYLSVSKDKLLRQAKQFLFAFTSHGVYDYTLKVVHLSNQTFSNFVTGQLLEAIIIGVLCYIGCLVLRFPYAPILSVIIGVTNVIPIFGAIFGVGVSALLVAFVNPLHGIFFIVFGICLQQFESNLIYPRVVGSTVGLSGLWVLFAISIGGGLFGFAGMLLGLPTFSVIYALLRQEIHRRSEKKANEIKSKKIITQPKG